jgi:hypothetical protein
MAGNGSKRSSLRAISKSRDGLASPKNGHLESSSALKQIDDEDDESNYEQEVDQAAANVAEQPKKPEHQQDDDYSPQHR